MVVEGIHVEDIFELVSLFFCLIISWIFRILAHVEDQCAVFLSIALKQTEAGPRSSGTPFLVTCCVVLIMASLLVVFCIDYGFITCCVLY